MACYDDVGTHSFCVRTKTFTGFRGCGFFWLSKPVHNASECDGSNAFQQIKFDTPFFWSDKTLAGESCSSSPRPARIMYDETRTKDGHAQAGESTGTFDFAPKKPSYVCTAHWRVEIFFIFDPVCRADPVYGTGSETHNIIYTNNT